MAGEGGRDGRREGRRRRDGQIKRTEGRGDKEENKDAGGNSRGCLEVRRRGPRRQRADGSGDSGRGLD